MQLTLNELIPEPLRDKLSTTNSGIWKKKVTMQEGECIFIQAPSGTGKTTLLHVLYGIRHDYAGAVVWGSDNMKRLNEDQLVVLRAQDISIIFQDMRLFPGLTAWENLQVKVALNGNIAESVIIEWMDRLGIAEKKNALAATLSYGEQQRVAILRGLLQPFRWLLMDEPFSHLDRDNTVKAIKLISEVVLQRKAGILLADLDENTYFPYTQTIML